MTVQSQKINLNYLIDPTSTNFDRLFVLSFQRIAEGYRRLQRLFFTLLHTKCWNKEFQCLNWWKKFFDLPVKNEEEAYEKIINMSKNNDYTTGNLLDFAYFKRKLQANCNWFN